MTFSARHRHRALGQIDRHDHGQHLWREPHRHGDREQQCLEPIALGQAVDHEHERGHDQDETEHHPGKPGDALVEAREHALLGNCARHLAEGGPRAGEHDDTAADAADDSTAHEADVGEIKRRLRGAGVGRQRIFSSGIASPVSVDWLMKRSFAEISLRSAGIMSPADSRTMSPGTSCSIGTSTWSCAVGTYLPAHGRGYRHHPLQLVGSIVGAMFLDEAQRDAQNHHDGDHDRGPLIAQEVGRRRKREQEQVQRVDRAADELAEDRVARLVSDLIAVPPNAAAPRPGRA